MMPDEQHVGPIYTLQPSPIYVYAVERNLHTERHIENMLFKTNETGSYVSLYGFRQKLWTLF